MAKKYKNNSRILKEMHESAGGLLKAGVIDKRRMQTFDALCLETVPEYSAEDVKRIRAKIKVSQSVLAAIMNTSVSAVRQWENGQKHPGGAASKLLSVLDRKGMEALA